MSTFKRIFLTLVLALFGAVSLPAMAVECQMQAGGQMACNDGKVYQVQTTPLENNATASSAANTSTLELSDKETAETAELAEIEAQKREYKKNGYTFSACWSDNGICFSFTKRPTKYPIFWFGYGRVPCPLWGGLYYGPYAF